MGLGWLLPLAEDEPLPLPEDDPLPLVDDEPLPEPTPTERACSVVGASADACSTKPRSTESSAAPITMDAVAVPSSKALLSRDSTANRKLFKPRARFRPAAA